MRATEVRAGRRAVTNGSLYFRRSCLAVGVICEVVFCWLATGGTWHIFQQRKLSDLYDVQARALFHGHWWMPASALSIEGIHTGAREYMYYGPFPALIRMPILLFTNHFDGRLTTLSMMAAYAVALLAVSRLTWKARACASPGTPVSKLAALASAAFVLVAGLGSILLWLASWVIVYHEAELWGAALTLAALDAVIGFVMSPSRAKVIGAGLLTTAAMLTRGSVAAGAVVALGILFVTHLALRTGEAMEPPPDDTAPAAASAAAASPRQRLAARLQVIGCSPAFGATRRPAHATEDKLQRRTFALPLLLATIVPVAAYAAINEAKFRSLFGLPLERQVWTSLSPHRRAVLAANHGGYFGLKYVPTALLQYLRPDALRYQALFPFVRFGPPAHVFGHVVYDVRDHASSAPDSMPLLVLFGIAGLVALFSRWPKGAQFSAFRVATLASVFGCAGALEIAYIANRYLSDFFPFILLTAAVGFQVVATHLPQAKTVLKAAVVGVAVVIGAGSIYVNVGLGFLYERVLEPGVTIPQRATFVALQERIDADLHGDNVSEVTRVAKLPPAGGLAGSLYITGNCAGLYQEVDGGWFPVEEGAAAGHLRFEVTFPNVVSPVHQPLVTVLGKGRNDILAVHYLGHNKIDFAYLPPLPGATWLDGIGVTIVPRRAYTHDVTLDPGVPNVAVMLNGAEVYNLFYFMVRGHTVVGRNVTSTPMAPRFTGTLRPEPVVTPICDDILHRLEAKS